MSNSSSPSQEGETSPWFHKSWALLQFSKDTPILPKMLPQLLLSRQLTVSLLDHFQKKNSAQWITVRNGWCYVSLHFKLYLLFLRTIRREWQVLTYKIGNTDFNMMTLPCLSSSTCEKMLFWRVQQALFQGMSHVLLAFQFPMLHITGSVCPGYTEEVYCH